MSKINEYNLSLYTLDDNLITLTFDKTAEESLSQINLSNNLILFVYRIAPDHPDIKPYYKVKYNMVKGFVYCANENELFDYLRSFFYSNKLTPCIA